MGDRARVIIQLGPDAFRSIYCHNNGSALFSILPKSYKKKDDVLALMALGDLSYLDNKIAKCDAYIRDWKRPVHENSARDTDRASLSEILQGSNDWIFGLEGKWQRYDEWSWGQRRI